MKLTTLFLIFTIAIGLGHAVDVSRVSEAFLSRVNNFKIERLESKVPYDVFFRNLSTTVAKFINDIIIELYRQMRFQTYLLSNTILSTNDELYYEVLYSKDNETNPFVDLLVDKLTGDLKDYLNLKPGLEEIKMAKLPAIPESAQLSNFVGYHGLDELFSGLETIVDTHLSNVNIVMDSFFKHGWQAARDSLKELKEEFRKEYLNGYLLQTCGTVVSNVLQNVEKIRRHVTPKTWSNFESNALVIKNLYDEIKPKFDDPFLKRLRY